MSHIHKMLVSLFIALAIAIPLSLVAMGTHVPKRPIVVQVAAEPTPTHSGSPCHGSGC